MAATAVVGAVGQLALASAARADLLPPQIHTVAGGGSCATTLVVANPSPPPAITTVVNPLCQGVSPTSVAIGYAASVAALPGGGFLYVDSENDLVQEVSPSGTVTTVAGNGTATDAPDGVIATDSGLDDPVAVTPLPDGSFLVTEGAGSVVRLVSAGPPGTATMTTIAGTGAPGYNGLSGPATSTQLNWPTDAEVTSDGQVLIADSYNNLVRVLSSAAPGATMDTVAGVAPGTPAGGGICDDVASGCDGQAAGTVILHHPVSVSPVQGGTGGFLIAEDEYHANVVRDVSSVSSAGTFSTVAGSPGPPGYGGDGGPATAAQLDQPSQVVSLPDGSFVIADTANERVREVSPSGTITTIAGNGVASYAGDGGNATDSSLDGPVSVSPTATGGLLIADQVNEVIRAITLAPVTTITLGPSSPNGGGGYYNTPVKVKITSTGKSIHCVLDPTEVPLSYQNLPSSCPYSGSGGSVSFDGHHTIYAAGVNSYGDQEIPIKISFTMDTTAPFVLCGPTPTFTYGAPGAQLESSVTDPGGSGPLTPLILTPVNDRRLGKQWVIVTAYDVALNPGGQVCYYTVLPRKFSPAPVLEWKFAPGRVSSTVKTLAVTHVPKGASVGVVCDAKSCPFAKRSVRSAGRTVDLSALFARRPLPAGAGLTIAVTAKGTIGRAFMLGLRSRRQPSYRATCLAPGATTPGKRC